VGDINVDSLQAVARNNANTATPSLTGVGTAEGVKMSDTLIV
jgi:hypothetical protein